MHRRLALVTLVAALAVLVPIGPASAHTRAGAATDWTSRIRSVDDVAGVRWELFPAAEYIGVSNDGAAPVTILGYEGEPYLRIGPEGVERNLNSPTTYLNQRRDGDVSLPPRADPDASPEWSSVTDGTSYAWFDHRVHRMPNDERPRAVGWTIPFVVDGRKHEVIGALALEAGPPWWRWLLIGSIPAAGAALWAVTRRRESLRASAALVAGVAAFNLIHIVDELAALPLSRLDIAYGVFHTVLFVGAGLIAVTITLRSKRPSWLPLWVGSAAVAFHQGFLQIQQLGAAELPTIWPAGFIRFAVGAALAQFAWTSAAALTLRRDPLTGPAPAREVAPASARPVGIGREVPS